MNQKYKQGYFQPKNRDKYVGDIGRIFFRSSWEKRFMNICDLSPKILKWSSEPFPINYFSPLDGKNHRYFVDFWILYQNSLGEIKKMLIEIKPESQTKKPELKGERITRKKQMNFIYEMNTYIINQQKWDACREFCRRENMDFLILTEKNLNIFH